MSENEEELFEVENVIDSRIVRGAVQYRVRWLNFSPRHDTWEPEDNLLTCHDLIEKYLTEKNAIVENNNSPAMDFENGDESNAGSSTMEDQKKEDANRSSPLTIVSDTKSKFETESNLFSNFNANVDEISALDEANTSKVSEQSEPEKDEEEAEEDKIKENEKIKMTPTKKRQSRKPRWEMVELKETFWKQLEKGQVDVSMSLYERVKRKRQAAEADAASTLPMKKESPLKRKTRGKKSKPSISNDSDNETDKTTADVIFDLKNEQEEEEEKQKKPPTASRPDSPSKSVKTYSRSKNKKAEDEIDELVKTIVSPNIMNTSEKKLNDSLSADKQNLDNGTRKSSGVKPDKSKNMNLIMNEQSTNEDVNKAVNPRAARFIARTVDEGFYAKLGKIVDDVVIQNTLNENVNSLPPSNGDATFDQKNKAGNRTVKVEDNILSEEGNGDISLEDTPVAATSVTSSEHGFQMFNPEIHLKNDIPFEKEKQTKIESIADISFTGEDEMALNNVKTKEPFLPARGRWLPLAPKLVTMNSDASVASDACNSMEIDGLEKCQSPPSLNILPAIQTPPPEEPHPSFSGNLVVSDLKQAPPHVEPPKIVTKRQIADLAIDIEEDLNVNDFFKTDMHKCQEEERVSGRFVTNDMFSEACRLGNFDIVRSALTASKNFKCPYDVEAIDIYGNTLLMSATVNKCDPWHSSDDVIELLAQYGANLNASNRSGETALMLAIEHEHLCKVTKLLSLGAAVNLPNRSGETPLMVASRKGFAMVAHRLLEYGADFNASTTNGRTVVDMAASSKGVLKVLQMHESRVKLAFEQELLTVIEPDKMKLKHTLFPMHCYAINESRTFRIMFNYKPFPFPPKHFVVLVVGIGKLGTHIVSVRFWGTSPVVSVLLNDVEQQAVQEDGRFIFTLSPLKSGANELLLKCADNYKTSQCKLLTSAFVVQIM